MRTGGPPSWPSLVISTSTTDHTDTEQLVVTQGEYPHRHSVFLAHDVYVVCGECVNRATGHTLYKVEGTSVLYIYTTIVERDMNIVGSIGSNRCCFSEHE